MAFATCPDENDLDGFAAGQLAGEAREAMVRHVAECEACQAVIAALARMRAVAAGSSSGIEHLASLYGEDAPALAPGTRVGRFSLHERVGEGGMGVVYSAYDSELDRRVALKFLRRGGEVGRSEGQARLLQEAQSMARLGHPNVVGVFDVGSHQGSVYVAMEFVDGRTLGAWLQERPRAIAEILEMYLQAGAGLAAAHAVELVHRDFKPDNVLVRWDGRAGVTDFGLARRVAPAPGGHEPSAAAVVAPSGAAAQAEPAADADRSARAGTPRYMAPEQLMGGRIDARTDQFGFCIALYEALVGALPFEGETVGERVAAMRAGRFEASGARMLPPRLAEALRRGLRADRAERFSSMDELCRALAPPPPARRWLGVVVALGLVLALALSVAAVVSAEDPDEVCRAEGALAADDWSPRRAGALEGALRAAGAGEAARAARDALDRYAARWSDAAVETCRASRVRQEQSLERFERRKACLDVRRRHLRALTTVLAGLQPGDASRIQAAVAVLPPIEDCSQPRRLPVLHAERPELIGHLASARVLAALGRRARAVESARAAAAAEAGDAGLEAVLLLAELLVDRPLATELARFVLEAAERLRLDRLVGLGAARLALLAEGAELGHLWTRYAAAAAERAGPDAELRGAVAQARARTEGIRGGAPTGPTSPAREDR